MQIANPIYDAVFKYLMEDKKIAKLFLSTIIEEEIVTIDFLPKEQTLFMEKGSLTVQKMDFSAKIKTENGEKQVISEVPKAKFSTDIIRFRKYLGEQYSRKEKHKKIIENKNRFFMKKDKVIEKLERKFSELKN